MSQMQYKVVSKSTAEAVAVDTVYTIDFNGKCWRMLDADGDSIPDACSLETTNNCDEIGTYKKVECNYRRKNWFRIGAERFSEYPNGNNLTKKWQLGLVTRTGGVTTAKYSCGEYCQIDLHDTTSDGKVDEAFLRINLYSVYFKGDMPYPAHEMLQRAVLTAFDHFLPGSFSKALGDGAWEVGVIAFSRDLAFAYNPYFLPGSRISFKGKPLIFATESETAASSAEAGETAEAAKIVEAPKQATGGKSHIMISESGGGMVDVTDDYSEFKPENLGVTPQTEGE